MAGSDVDRTDLETHRDKYARIERERRFLVHALPAERALRVRRIVDRYFVDTRLRLRMMEDVESAPPARVYKLTQKIPGPPSRSSQGLITNIYLSDTEYHLLSGIPAAVLQKTRYSIPPMGIDVFESALRGLLIAEAEFESDEDMRAFLPPAYLAAEVTRDQRFTGGRLVSATREEIASWLREYGIDVVIG
ncbi:MAG: hypothetical protein M3003_15420 [Candidatus Dormibacteraeota bacterium]|nr:hypothetical protein [Candidatus Dormibacteraeota bacterium]